MSKTYTSDARLRIGKKRAGLRELTVYVGNLTLILYQMSVVPYEFNFDRVRH